MTVKNTVLNLLNKLIVTLRLSNLIIKCKLLATKILTKTKLFSESLRSTKSRISNLNIQRIKVETRHSNGKNGASVIETPFLFSFGVTERLNQETNQLTGSSIPICLWDKESQPNENEKAFFEAIRKITQICQQYLEEEFGADTASYLTNSLHWKQVEYMDRKGKTKNKRMNQLLQYFMQNSYILINQRKYFPYFLQKEMTKVDPFTNLNYLHLDGKSHKGGDFNINNKKIIHLLQPTSDTDAVTKKIRR